MLGTEALNRAVPHLIIEITGARVCVRAGSNNRPLRRSIGSERGFPSYRPQPRDYTPVWLGCNQESRAPGTLGPERWTLGGALKEGRKGRYFYLSYCASTSRVAPLPSHLAGYRRRRRSEDSNANLIIELRIRTFPRALYASPFSHTIISPPEHTARVGSRLPGRVNRLLRCGPGRGGPKDSRVDASPIELDWAG